jgi:hypothetical protein
MKSIASRFVAVLGHLVLGVGLVLSAARGAPAPTPDPKTLPPPKRVVIPKLKGSVKIDAELNEPMWAKAAQLGPFVPADGKSAAREQTIVRAWYDDHALYLGWTCNDTDIQATFTKRDSKFWEEEVAEFFITAKDLARYFELQWNPLGGEFDAIIANSLDERGVSKKIDGDWSYTAKGMKSAVKVKGTVANGNDRDELWQVEVVIPFADLEQSTPKPGDVWRANFYRFNRGNNLPVEQLSWTPPMLPGFHQPSRFGYLEFGK